MGAAALLLAHGACPRCLAKVMDDGRHHRGGDDDVEEVHLLASVPPVHLACLCQSPDAAAELLTCLLAARADPNEKDAQGYTPLRLLACRGNAAVGAAELAAMLLAAGAQPELADGRGRTRGPRDGRTRGHARKRMQFGIEI